MKLKDPTLKIITPHNDIIDTLLQFSDRNNYTKIFNKIFKSLEIQFVDQLLRSADDHRGRKPKLAKLLLAALEVQQTPKNLRFADSIVIVDRLKLM